MADIKPFTREQAELALTAAKLYKAAEEAQRLHHGVTDKESVQLLEATKLRAVATLKEIFNGVSVAPAQPAPQPVIEDKPEPNKYLS